MKKSQRARGQKQLCQCSKVFQSLVSDEPFLFSIVEDER